MQNPLTIPEREQVRFLARRDVTIAKAKRRAQDMVFYRGRANAENEILEQYNPLQSFSCSICGAAAPHKLLRTGPQRGQFANRMAWLRHHYKTQHPRAFKAMVAKSIATRKAHQLLAMRNNPEDIDVLELIRSIQNWELYYDMLTYYNIVLGRKVSDVTVQRLFAKYQKAILKQSRSILTTRFQEARTRTDKILAIDSLMYQVEHGYLGLIEGPDRERVRAIVQAMQVFTNPLTDDEKRSLRHRANQEFHTARQDLDPIEAQFYRGRSVGLDKIAKLF